MAKTNDTLTDSRGNALGIGDKVRFISWGYNVSLGMTQGTHEVVGFGRTRVRLSLDGYHDKVVAVRTEQVTKVDANGRFVGKPKEVRA